ncbi:MAG: Na(+)/H(+) antiporter subunit B [Thiolinea sp.]
MDAETLWTLFDLLLIISLAVLALVAVLSGDRRRSIVLFIIFGLLLALVWARLRAPDIALAEVAIGAGLGGALLMATLRRHQQTRDDFRHRPAWLQWSVGLLVMLLGTGMAWSLLLVMDAQPADWRLGAEAFAELDNSGVSNPVTAVLLNFRAWDTLLELAVLLAAILGIKALGKPEPAYVSENAFRDLALWLTPLLVLMAGYILWAGAHAPGGAFQAGALLAAAGIILRLAGKPDGGLPHNETALRLGLALGTAVFLLVALGVILAGNTLLQYPPDQAKWWILLIETAATLSIGMTLTLAFIGGSPTLAKDAA